MESSPGEETPLKPASPQRQRELIDKDRDRWSRPVYSYNYLYIQPGDNTKETHKPIPKKIKKKQANQILQHSRPGWLKFQRLLLYPLQPLADSPIHFREKTKIQVYKTGGVHKPLHLWYLAIHILYVDTITNTEFNIQYTNISTLSWRSEDGHFPISQYNGQYPNNNKNIRQCANAIYEWHVPIYKLNIYHYSE